MGIDDPVLSDLPEPEVIRHGVEAIRSVHVGAITLPVAVLAFVTVVAVIGIAKSALRVAKREGRLVPFLAPLAFFATFGIFTLRRGAAGALDWFGALAFAVFAGLVWLGYIAMQTGVPSRTSVAISAARPSTTSSSRTSVDPNLTTSGRFTVVASRRRPRGTGATRDRDT